MTLYLAARFLGMDAQTWDSQPYWAQKVYIEGLYTERPWQTKLDSDPATWFSTLDSKINDDTFAELKTKDDVENDDSIQDNDVVVDVVDDDEEFIRWKHLPDITDIVKPTYIDIPLS